MNNASQSEIDFVDSAATRALFVGGLTDRFLPAWDDGDVVQVYKGSSLVGTMTPQSAYWGTKTATLTGTLTGSFAVDDQLELYLPSKAIDLTNQTGTLQGVSTKCFQNQTIAVTEASNSILSLSDVNMGHRVTYVRFSLTDENGGARLHPSKLVIHPVSGGTAVLKMDADGNVTETGDIEVNIPVVRGEYPSDIYVAILNESDATVTYNFKATVGDDIYVGPISSQNQYAPALGNFKGTLRGAERKMRKTTAASTLTVEAIPAVTFTGSAHEPVVTVKDGEEVLTLDTDYSVSYSGNTGAGEATVTVTGLADAGALAATKYLGTQAVHFTIAKATPVVLLSTDDMTLEVSTTQTRTVTKVFVDNNGNSIYDDGDYDITSEATVTYSSADAGIASVDATTGEVTGVATGTTTITATVAAADNWNTQTVSYTVKVSPRVNTIGNSPWTVTEEAEEGTVYQ